ncbi:MAG: TonB-dependent receptor plug domain-containing protein [Thermodesulfobacteriota bacterium]
MRRLKWICVAVAFSIYGYPLSLSAQEKAREVYRLDEVVVSATRSEIPVFDAPQSVTVISNEELMASPFERVEDIVRSVPGVYNFRHFGLQTNGIVSPLKMRGVGSNRVLVLVDGVPQNDNFNNAIAWVAWGHIPKETIERIEIVRGPTSTLYGSEGLGGVIHIITKTPDAERQTSIRGKAGTADTYGGYGFHTQKINDFGFLIAGGYEESDGFYMTEDPADYEIKRHREVGKIFGKATYDLTPASDISLTALYYDHETGKGRKFFYDDLTLDQYWLNYTHNGDAFGLKGLIYFNRADKTAFQDTAKDDFASLLRMEEMPSTTWGGDFQGSIPLGSGADLILGAAYKESAWDYDDEYVDSPRDVGAEGKQRFISPFAHLNLHFLEDNLIVNLGARYDWIRTSDGANWDNRGSAGKDSYENTFDSDTEGSFSPKLGLAWHPDDKTTLRASGGKGFRAPSLFELYKVHVRGGGTFYREANPDLEPEEIWSYDVGAERFLTDSLWGRLTFYQSFAEDYIGDRLTGTGTFAGGKTRYEYQLDNISEVDIYGIETEVEWFPRTDLSIFANYTYNISEIKKDENDADLEGNYLPNDPRHKAHFGFRYQNPRIVNVSLIANYYADMYFDNENTLKESGYFTMDASLSRRFFDRFTAYLNVENIFDEEYPIFRSRGRSDTIAPGAIVTGGLTVEF